MKPATLALVLTLAFDVSSSDAAEKKADTPTFLDPKEAGPDFALQGEFTGQLGDKRVGAQILALGDGKFRGLMYMGGLPGDGWNGEDAIEGDGELRDGKAEFTGKSDKGRASVANDKVTGVTGGGDPFTLERITRTSPTAGAKPPKGAIVLFDGSNADAWSNGHVDDRKLLQAGTRTKQLFQDFTLHVEFLLPFKPHARGQARGNSGVYLQDRYEVQVLDSFALKGLDNECGGLYKQVAPRVNMCFPPLQWQTYDIHFQAARFGADGNKTKNAIITVKHNGVAIHDRQEITGPTGGGKKEDSTPGAIQLQGHGNPVFYRNVWVVEK
jgi:hypothetical protein